jgi:hypothetical protein
VVIRNRKITYPPFSSILHMLAQSWTPFTGKFPGTPSYLRRKLKDEELQKKKDEEALGT